MTASDSLIEAIKARDLAAVQRELEENGTGVGPPQHCERIDRETQENEELRRDLAAVREIIYSD